MANDTPEPPFAWSAWGWLIQAAGIVLIVHASYAEPIARNARNARNAKTISHSGFLLCLLGVALCRYSLPRHVRLPPPLHAFAVSLLIGGMVLLGATEMFAALPASTLQPARWAVAAGFLGMLAISILVYVRSRAAGNAGSTSARDEHA